ncbi:electron transport complex subunit RsxC [Ferrimonas gelatinilytica]|uniref:Ion-translocating oxidoreductase complex subunit C n=1 Tax=Ferrimonas gelatinilytica TaxID=1255257 RepID=A0ABP9RY87_9GAMM
MQTLLEQLDQGQLWTFPGGIHPPERKTLSNQTPIKRLPLPPSLWIPLRQHAGSEGMLRVKPGQRVLKGDALTWADSPWSVPVHAPTSGTIAAIEPRVTAHPSGLRELGVELIPDGQDHWRPRETRSSVQGLERDELHRVIRDAGIAGLGGATFPAAVKLAPANRVTALLINGAECEPYISADDRLMREHAGEILLGIEVLIHMLNPDRVVIAIEDNKPEALAAISKALEASHLDQEQVKIRSIPTKYPSGSEKQLIQILTGQEVPKGKLPVDLGMLMHNVGTCYAIKKAVFDDEPLIERVVTITGEQAGQAGNYWTLLGSPIRWVLQQSGANPLPAQPLIMGGPMMGFALPDIDAPVVKATNCLLVPSREELPEQPKPRNCIRCGDCAQVCPQLLLPQQLFWHSQAKEYDKADKLNLFDCIECGVCAYVCPSDIPLVEHYRIAKAALRDQSTSAAKAEQAKIRFEARKARLEAEKQAREQRSQRAKATPGAAPSAGVAAAIAKLKAKQAEQSPEANEGKGDEQDMAELRRQRKAQARVAKAQKAQPSPDDAPKAAVAAAIARAKAKQAQAQGSAEPTEPSQDTQPTPKPSTSSSDSAKNPAVAAAIARAKAKQAQKQGEKGDTERTRETSVDQSGSAGPSGASKSPAVAAAIAKAKAKQSAATAEARPAGDTLTQGGTGDAPEKKDAGDAKRKAAVAAAIAKAKAKQAAATAEARPAGDTLTQGSTGDALEKKDAGDAKRKAAVAAAIAKAKAKQAAATAEARPAGDTITQGSTGDAQEKKDDGDARRKAAVAAAIAKAKAKQAAARSQGGDTQKNDENEND